MAIAHAHAVSQGGRELKCQQQLQKEQHAAKKKPRRARGTNGSRRSRWRIFKGVAACRRRSGALRSWQVPAPGLGASFIVLTGAVGCRAGGAANKAGVLIQVCVCARAAAREGHTVQARPRTPQRFEGKGAAGRPCAPAARRLNTGRRGLGSLAPREGARPRDGGALRIDGAKG
ncbi:MAG: hypothetical protein J3K34DRAFT_444512 [Monoraphidium minutum]|nr:MAG: hypothetical protein J3K34DRAFT_444512 [Monoraphidium minutum]